MDASFVVAFDLAEKNADKGERDGGVSLLLSTAGGMQMRENES